MSKFEVVEHKSSSYAPREVRYIFEEFDAKGDAGEWLSEWSVPTGTKNKYEKHRSLSWRRWCDIVQRCREGGKFQERRITYKGVLNRFSDFQNFTNWSISQIGYDIKDDKGQLYVLDKDILSEEFKVYSEDTCLFVPKSINNFILGSGRIRGDYPVGVYKHKQSGLFHSRIKIEAKQKSLGYFTDPLSAHRAWQKAKYEMTYSIADSFKNTHEKLYEGLSKWAMKIEAEYNCFKETHL